MHGTRIEGDDRPVIRTYFRKTFDAQRIAVHRSQVSLAQTTNPTSYSTLLLTAVMLLLVPGARGAMGDASVVGIVRDTQGMAQRGALVQVLSFELQPVGIAITDSQGRYLVGGLLPGRYLVRASESLFLPASRANLQLSNGVTATVDLTLASLFDKASWLPARRRSATEPEDDWKWTLRCPANRPILRVLNGDQEDRRASELPSAQARSHTRARASLKAGDGEFGDGGLQSVFALHHAFVDGSETMLRAQVNSASSSLTAVRSSEFDAGFETPDRNGRATRTVIRIKSHPELASRSAPNGLTVLDFESAERMQFGDRIVVEAGGNIEGIKSAQSVLVTRPFLVVTAHPTAEWTIHYQMASDPALQAYEDTVVSQRELPSVFVEQGHTIVPTSRHQEISLARRHGRTTLEIAYVHDALDAATVLGGGAKQHAGKAVANDSLLVDPTTGALQALAPGYTASGARVSLTGALSPELWVAAEYSSGEAIESDAGGSHAGAPEQALGSLKPSRGQAATLAVKGNIPQSGTGFRASYRWQPTRLVTAIDPYRAFSEQAFFSFQLRQPIRLGARLPEGLDATVDVTNLLAQGYRPFLSADGQTLYFAQSPRVMQAGLSFSF